MSDVLHSSVSRVKVRRSNAAASSQGLQVDNSAKQCE